MWNVFFGVIILSGKIFIVHKNSILIMAASQTRTSRKACLNIYRFCLFCPYINTVIKQILTSASRKYFQTNSSVHCINVRKERTFFISQNTKLSCLQKIVHSMLALQGLWYFALWQFCKFVCWWLVEYPAAFVTCRCNESTCMGVCVFVWIFFLFIY